MTTTVKIDGKNVMATPTGLKLGSRGRVQSPGEVFGLLDKGTARKLRKELAGGGFPSHARQSRTSPTTLKIAA